MEVDWHRSFIREWLGQWVSQAKLWLAIHSHLCHSCALCLGGVCVQLGWCCWQYIEMKIIVLLLELVRDLQWQTIADSVCIFLFFLSLSVFPFWKITTAKSPNHWKIKTHPSRKVAVLENKYKIVGRFLSYVFFRTIKNIFEILGRQIMQSENFLLY